MEPFAIQCATCKARLKVRELAAIGQILACPKCGSMVQVQPPPGWKPPADGETSAPAAASPAIQSSPGPTTDGLDPSVTLRVPILPKSALAGGTATNAGASLPATSDSASDSSTGSSSSESAEEIDLLEPHRRWQRWILATGIAAILLVGVLVGLFGRSRRLTVDRSSAAKTEPATQRPTDVARPARSASPTARPPLEEGPLEPLVVDPRFVPSDARLIWSFRFSAASHSAATRAWFEYLYPLWGALLSPVHETMAANSNRLTGFTWVAADLGSWDSAGLAVLEFRDRLPTDAPLVANSKPLETKLQNAVIYAPPQGTWPHPYVVIGERTLLLGPEELLTALARRDADQAISPNGKAAEAPSNDASPDEKAAEKPAEAADAKPAEPASAPAPAVPAPVALKLPTKHDFVLAMALTGQGERIKSWLPGMLSLPTLATNQVSWNLVQSGQLSVDAQEAYARVRLVFTCANDSDASQLEKQLRQELAAAQQKLAQLLATTRADALEKNRVAAGLAKTIGESELANTAHILRERSVVRIQANVSQGLAEAGIAALRETPAVASIRQPAALAMGEPRMASLAQGLSRATEADQQFPAAAAGSPILPADSRLSWIATLLAYYGHEDWRKTINLARSWQDAENQPVTRQPLDAVLNPFFSESTTPEGYPVSHYVGISGVGTDAVELPADSPRAGVFGNQPRRVDAVRDGTANTIAVMGVRERWGPWSAGGPSTVRPITAEPVVNGPDGFGTGQADGMLVGMADGSVRFLSAEVDPRVVQQLATINGGESKAIASLDPVTAPKVEPPSEAKAPAPGDNPPAVEPQESAEAPSAGGGLRTVNVEERLKDPVRSLQVDRMPLAQFLELVDGLSTLSITIDFEQIGISNAALLPISVRSEDTTVGALLAQALAEHGLAFVADGESLYVRRNDASSQTKPATYEVADLLVVPPGSKPTSPDSAPLLVQLLQQLVEPSTWAGAGGKGTVRLDGSKLIVEQSQAAQRQIADLLDRLRTARGKSKLAPTEAQARLATSWTAIEPKLELPLSVNFLDGTPLMRILAYLREKTDIEFVVDWPALAAAKAGPDAVAGLHVQNQSLDTALQAMLTPLGLTYRPIDGRTIQITTLASLEKAPEVEFYPLRPLPVAGDAGTALIERLQGEVSPESWKGMPPAAVAVVDPGSRYLIVRGSSPLQRQVGKAVQQWRSAASKTKAPTN